MKQKLLLSFSAITIMVIVVTFTFNSSNAYSSGSPNAHTGAPMDNSGSTCVSCHAGTVSTSTTNIISSDIPVTGFVSGVTYNFTVTMSGSAAYGFEVSAQTPNSNSAVGTLIASDAGTKISGNYITQNTKKTGTSATWTFQWTAPPTGTTVTIYGAFNYANNNSSTSGDIIKTSSATYLINTITTGINEITTNNNLLSVYPNPTTDFLHINSNEIFTKGSIYALDGSLVKTLTENELSSKTILLSNLASGIYYINISSNVKNFTAKITKNN